MVWLHSLRGLVAVANPVEGVEDISGVAVELLTSVVGNGDCVLASPGVLDGSGVGSSNPLSDGGARGEDGDVMIIAPGFGTIVVVLICGWP